MLYYNRTDVSEDIEVNIILTSKECIIYKCWYFLVVQITFQTNVRNACHVISLMSIDINSIAILNIHGVDWC